MGLGQGEFRAVNACITHLRLTTEHRRYKYIHSGAQFVKLCKYKSLEFGSSLLLLLLLLHCGRDHSPLYFAGGSLWHIVCEIDLKPSARFKSMGTRLTFFGTLNLATFCVSQLRNSSELSFWSGFRTTATPISWPYISSSMAKLTASDTAGCWPNELSSSIGLIFSPFVDQLFDSPRDEDVTVLVLLALISRFEETVLRE